MKHPVPLSLSDEQQAVYDASLQGDSVSVNACAGSGKSHTARAIAKNIGGLVESIPFMRALMQEEQSTYAGSTNVTSLNFHSRGLRLCNGGNGKVRVDDYKLTELAKAIDAENSAGIASLAAMFKAEGVGVYDKALTPTAIADKYSIDQELVPQAIDVLAQSDAKLDTVDFADMLRLPILLGRKLTLQGLIVLDEVQDYTPASWVFVRDCLTSPQSHVLMIGDPSRQMLMSFAGASKSIFDIMSDQFGCTRLGLTVNRRCAKRIVEAAPFRGDMQALPNAPDGEVISMPTADALQAIEDNSHGNDAILSETNAPLVQLGLNLLTKGTPCRMRAKRLESCIRGTAYKYLDCRKYPFPSFSISEACKRDQQEANSEGTNSDTSRDDVIACIASLETYCIAKQITKTQFVRRGSRWAPVHPIFVALNRLLQSNEGITLLTGHTAKGLEFPTVFHLPGNMKASTQDWQTHQNNCLAHVIATRAKTKLVTLSE
jgi:hypothetical protein